VIAIKQNIDNIENKFYKETLKLQEETIKRVERLTKKKVINNLFFERLIKSDILQEQKEKNNHTAFIIEKQWKRARDCSLFLKTNIDKAVIKNTSLCKNRFCLICNNIRAYKRTQKIEQINQIKNIDIDKFYMLTLTSANRPKEELKEWYKQDSLIFQKIKNLATKKKIDKTGIKNIETTQNKTTKEAHLHYHIIGYKDYIDLVKAQWIKAYNKIDKEKKTEKKSVEEYCQNIKKFNGDFQEVLKYVVKIDKTSDPDFLYYVSETFYNQKTTCFSGDYHRIIEQEEEQEEEQDKSFKRDVLNIHKENLKNYPFYYVFAFDYSYRGTEEEQEGNRFLENNQEQEEISKIKLNNHLTDKQKYYIYANMYKKDQIKEKQERKELKAIEQQKKTLLSLLNNDYRTNIIIDYLEEKRELFRIKNIYHRLKDIYNSNNNHIDNILNILINNLDNIESELFIYYNQVKQEEKNKNE
jgi:hypothetical protein